ncbi:cyanophycin synthetase [Desulfuribacillus stibiiarsenatis]|uniref:Cyanophycin synthetase n=1 Tax=Desulfuribacillus stibiiarsenatis TaxID=1390249 RepID=A0A1E5L8Y4_9FIRM|nr:cyanophycin synthetase [Desulfuribacillus stibiiarsenatis]OEH86403.1 cyanophycin synthetase [Desulfuribacillus stibiiarsenatis]
MKIISMKTFTGRNIYSHKPVVKMLLDLEDIHDKTTVDFKMFNKRLLELFPNLVQHHCGLGKHGGFVERILEGTFFGHVIEHVILELQVILGYDVYFGKTRLHQEPSLYNVVFEYQNETVAVECAVQAIHIVEGIMKTQYVNTSNIIYDLRKIQEKSELGPSSKAIYEEAKRRGIPVRRLGEDSLLELGYGKYARFVQAALTDATSGIAIDLSCNKELTKQILMENNIPVPIGAIANSLDDAIVIADEIGYPVVLKPLNGNQGKGVVLNINTPEELEENYRIPTDYNNQVIVEKYVTGRDYRVLVINDKVCAVAERKVPEIVGNGIHTIRELVNIENNNELRGYGHEKPLTKIRLDRIALNYLERFGLHEHSVPALGQVIKLRENGNISTGGSARECTDEIHPDNIAIAINAARAIGLDIAGIDITSSDISQPMKDNGGAIIEVNAVPGLRMHLHPSEGNSINVAADILDYLYPDGTPYSVPILAITGTNGKTTTTRMVAHTLCVSGKKVGMASSSGIYIDKNCVLKGDNTGPKSARNILNSKDIDAAVLEVARGGIVKRGLGYDLADVGVILNIGDDHIGQDGIDTREDLAFVKSLVVEAVKPEGYSVLNADDPMVEYFMSRACGSIILFSRNPLNRVLIQHIEQGHTAMYTQDHHIFLCEKGEHTKLIDVSSIPITFDGNLECNIENVLAAASALYAMHTPVDMIKHGLRTFIPDIQMNPGRFNIFEIGNKKVMIDYGHNINGYKEVGKFISKLNVSRSIGVIGVPGDRSNEQIISIGAKCAELFEKVYIKEDKDLRERNPGEVAYLLHQGLLSADFNPDNIQVIPCEVEALRTAISESEDGDFITLLYEDLDPVVSLITELQNEELSKLELSLTS